MTTELDTQEEIYLFNTQKPIANLDGDTQQKGFREIVLGAKKEDEHQDLWLKLRDDDFTWRNLYLGRSKTFEKDTAPEHYNMVVPIIPRCYATPDRDPAAAVVPPKGWLYIIRRFDSHRGTVVELWRELKSDGLGNFSDVHLKKYKGRDQRKATGQYGFRVIVPYCIDQEPHEIWIAYSEVQWSWARIQSMKKDEKLRDLRMHKLDLSDCLNNFQNSNYADGTGDEDSPEIKNVSGPALLYNLNTAPDAESKGADAIMKDDIPVVYLDNPVGIAKDLGLLYQYACIMMKNYVENLTSAPGLLQKETVGGAKESDAEKELKEDLQKRQKILYALDATPYDSLRWFDSAKILNQFLYAKLPDTPPEDLTADEKDDFRKQKKKTEEKRSEYLEKINTEDLKKALRNEERKILREDIIEAKCWLVEFLENELVARGKTSALLNALDDYFTLSAKVEDERALRLKKIGSFDVYADAWKVFSEIIQHLDKHEYTFDSELEPLADDGWTLRKEDGGVNLLIKIADPQENLPIHNRLFPKIARADKPLQVDDTKVEDDNPEFKADYFDNLKDVELDRALQSTSDFPAKFNEVIAMDDRDDDEYRQKIERVQQSLSRLNNGVLKSELEEVQASTDDILEYKAGSETQTGSRKLQKTILAFGEDDTGSFERVSINQDEDSQTDSDTNDGVQATRRAIQTSGEGAKVYFKGANENMDARMNSQTTLESQFLSSQEVTGGQEAKGGDWEAKEVTITQTKGAKGKNTNVISSPSGFGDEVKLVLKKEGPKLKNARKLKGYKVKAVMVLKEEARKRLADLIGENKIRIGAVGKLFAIVETINLVNTFQKVMDNKNDDKRARLAAELVSSFCDAAVAVGEVATKTTAKSGVRAASGGDYNVFGLKEKGVAKTIQKVRTLEILGYVGGTIDIYLSWQSMIENYRQNDNAYIGYAIQVSGYVVLTFSGAIATIVGLSVGLVTGIGFFVVLVGLLTVAFIFPEDSHIEFWLANGPFALGNGNCWNNGPYMEYKKMPITMKESDRPVTKDCTVYHYDGTRTNDWFRLAVDDAGNLFGAFQDSSNKTGHKLRVEDESGRVYLKAGKHPLAKKDTLIGVIGRPYNPIPMMQPQIEARFMRHTPGADPMSNVPTSNKSLFKPEPDHGRRPEYRCAMWCEYPDEAYASLMDCLYRPRLTLLRTPLVFGSGPFPVTFNIHLPYYINGKSVLYIDFTDIDADTGEEIIEVYEPGEKNVEELKDDSGDYVITRTINLSQIRKFIVKVRLDIFGDGKIQLPYEPLFCDSDIETGTERNDTETETDEKTFKGVQQPTDSKWIVLDKLVYIHTLQPLDNKKTRYMQYR